MQTKNYELEELGLESWLELFQILAAEDLLKEKTVILFWPNEPRENGDPDEELPIETVYILMRAFTELYQRLPLRGTVEFMIDEILSAEPGAKMDDHLVSFLRKLPTRTN